MSKKNASPDTHLNVKQFLEFHTMALEDPAQYSDNFLVVMQVGTFYEIYNADGKGADLDRVADILGYDIAKKGSYHEVGIPVASLDWGLAKLHFGDKENDIKGYYKILIVVQVDDSNVPNKNKKGKERVLARISTPGTYTSHQETEKRSRQAKETMGLLTHVFIMEYPESKEFPGYKPHICSICSVDVGNGKIELYEVANTQYDQSYAVHQVSSYILKKMPAEIIISSNLEPSIAKFVNDANIENISNAMVRPVVEGEYFKRTYQNQFLKGVYSDTGLQTPIQWMGLEKHATSVVSLVLTIQYIHEHHDLLLRLLQKPEILDDEMQMTISPATVSQLEIMHSKHGNSVLKILDKCQTPGGKRLLSHRLQCPIVDAEELNHRYEYIDTFIKNNLWKKITNKLITKVNIDHMFSKICLNRISPSAMYKFIMALHQYKELFEELTNVTDLVPQDIIPLMDELLTELAGINVDVAKGYVSEDALDQNVFTKGYNESIDVLSKILYQNELIRNGVAKNLSLRLNPNNPSIFKIAFGDYGFCFECTPTQFETLKENIKKTPLVLSFKDKTFNLTVKTLQLISSKKSKKSFTFLDVIPVAEDYMSTLDLFRQATKVEFHKFLTQISTKYNKIIKRISNVVSEIDLYHALARVAVERNYCRPTIQEDEYDRSWYNAVDLRHPIVEIETMEKYVPHNVKLGINHPDEDNTENLAQGQIVLLFSSNTAGKSTFLKKNAIALWLAQSGCYVPATSFTYVPFRSLYTRILTEDNVHQSISSFGAELDELKPILMRSNKNTLVLCDELAHSTNPVESQVIVAAALLEMAERGCPTICTTHITNLSKMDDITGNPSIHIYHLKLDITPDGIKYDRRLTKGTGPIIYALEIATKYGLPKSFLNRAHNMRRIVLEENDKFLSFKKSNYNSKLYMGKCFICNKNNAEETHHVVPQKDAVNNYVGPMNIHTYSNLIPICKKCHDNITYNRKDD